jgi:D-alanyl-lipoteichoic acid acyltransferase DltB (MBOAT superfamily)
MSFDSVAFLIFFLVCWLIYGRLPSERGRRRFLVGAGFFFYGFWDYRYTALMGFVIGVAFLAGRVIAAAQTERRRRVALAVAVTSPLCVLGWFKYAGFAAASAQGVASALGLPLRIPAVDILLPVGISFYTFHAISYVTDVYRRKVPAETSAASVALYICFFPQLIAGPIVRATHFLPQIPVARVPPVPDLIEGLRTFLLGFLFKTVIADNMAAIADPVFTTPQDWDCLGLWTGAIAYHAQIYFDFAGYSLMAIGCAAWFGYRFPANFNHPYIACSVTEFWRRWHISLSTWLRDYLYIPLGGNRLGPLRRYAALLLVMVLGGLWHGASWNFVLWGTMHGCALVVHKLWSDRKGESAPGNDVPLAVAAGWLITQTWVLLAWVWFRAPDSGKALVILEGLLGTGAGRPETYPIGILLAVLAPLALDMWTGWRRAVSPRLTLPGWAWGAGVGAMTALALWLKPLNEAPFIYFQF